MFSKPSEELLDSYHKAARVGLPDRLLWFFVLIIFGSWFPAMLLAGPHPPASFFVVTVVPVVIWAIATALRRRRAVADPELKFLEEKPMQLQNVDFKALWPSKQEAMEAPWQRYLLVGANAYAVVGLFFGVFAVARMSGLWDRLF